MKGSKPTIKILSSTDLSGLQKVWMLSRLWLDTTFEQNIWNDGAFHYVRSVEELVVLIEQFDARVITAWEKGTLVGYQILLPNAPSITGDPEFGDEAWFDSQELAHEMGLPEGARIGENYHIAVAHGHRRKGIGHALHAAMLKEAKKLGLAGLMCEVLIAPARNVASLNFHCSLGWNFDEERFEEDDEFQEGVVLHWARLYLDLS